MASFQKFQLDPPFSSKKILSANLYSTSPFKSLASKEAVYLPTAVRGRISNHRGGSVSVPAACRARCCLLCLTLWARPELGDEVPGEQTLLHR